ncbi:MAG: hypothetical protein Q4D95_03320, partial [Peptoniphilus sp.]|nr:hypothetical protein [Peptoniphilus sp.]
MSPIRLIVVLLAIVSLAILYFSILFTLIRNNINKLYKLFEENDAFSYDRALNRQDLNAQAQSFMERAVVKRNYSADAFEFLYKNRIIKGTHDKFYFDRKNLKTEKKNANFLM